MLLKRREIFVLLNNFFFLRTFKVTQLKVGICLNIYIYIYIYIYIDKDKEIITTEFTTSSFALLHR